MFRSRIQWNDLDAYHRVCIDNTSETSRYIVFVDVCVLLLWVCISPYICVVVSVFVCVSLCLLLYGYLHGCIGILNAWMCIVRRTSRQHKPSCRRLQRVTEVRAPDRARVTTCGLARALCYVFHRGPHWTHRCLESCPMCGPRTN